MFAFVQFLLLAGFAVQGIPVRPSESGTVTGVLRTVAGTPAAAIRVAAMAQPENAQDAAAGAALVSIGQTDETGRYRLDSIPPGRYYITAGRIDLPTYYPGTTERDRGRDIQITPGANITGIDFTMALDSEFRIPLRWSIPVSVVVEGGGNVPVYSAGAFPALRLTNLATTGRSELRMNGDSIAPQGSPPSEYRVSLENLSGEYVVKSMRFGSTDLAVNPLRISRGDFPVDQTTLLSNEPVLSIDFRTIQSSSVQSKTGIVITLTARPAVTPASGVRVSGKTRADLARPIFLSNMPGTLYRDGTFEFVGVHPGWHIIAAVDSLTQQDLLAAAVHVGERDLDGVQLSQVPVLPLDFQSQPASVVPGTQGSAPAAASLRGQVASDATGPVRSGALTILGYSNSQAMYAIENGKFEIPDLLPGSYELKLSIFDHFTLSRTVVIGIDDITLDLTIKRAY